MRIIESVSEMQQQAGAWHREGKTICLVPTMGYLHSGHQALMRTAREGTDVVVASIFVNPTQFGPGEDFERYPRDLERDTRLAEQAGVDVIFAPRPREMYPEGFQTYIEVSEVTLPLCGQKRPGHFRGVTTVVTKLFNIVKPHRAIFGEKDFQQLVTIRRMVRDLNMEVEIVAHPIVRESDGLAMSSRNTYLNPEQRQVALCLSQSLETAQGMIDNGERNGEVILKKVREIVEARAGARIDYAQLAQPETLEATGALDGPCLLALAVFVGGVRLIDNRILYPAK